MPTDSKLESVPHNPRHDDVWEAKLLREGDVLQEEWVVLPQLVQVAMQQPDRHHYTCNTNSTTLYPQLPVSAEIITLKQFVYIKRTGRGK